MNTRRPKVTVVIPVHDDAAYLRACLDSVVGQTLADIEIVCIDDASTDGSRAILEDYRARDARIRLIPYDVNRSASQARKDGALAATGEYVMFLDADDYLEISACEDLYGLIRQHAVEILHFGTAVINMGNVPAARQENIERFTRPYPQRLTGRDVFEACFVRENFGFTIWNKIYSAELCRRAFPFIPDGSFPKAQDLFAFFVLAYFAQSYVGVADACYHHYRFGSGLTGHNQMPLDKFVLHCSQVRVSQAIRRFLEQQAAFDAYQDAYRKMHEHLLFECVWNWMRNMASEDQAKGYEILVGAWGIEDVMKAITLQRSYERAKVEAADARAQTRNAIEQIRRSWSFRIGSAILFVPGKIYAWWNSGTR